MTATENRYDRITFSLPHEINQELDNLKRELQASKSELIKRAVEDFIVRQKEERLARAVEMMAVEYEESDMTALDGEAFL